MNTPKNVLIVEDNAGDAFLLTRKLKATSVIIRNIFVCQSMAQVQTYSGQSVDLAFLDLSLPDSDGVDTFGLFKKILPDVPVIILSGLADMSVAQHAIALGAQDYLVKDQFDEKLLNKSILYTIERHRNVSQLKQLEHQLAEQKVHQQKLITEATILAQEKERNDIGKELHDNINQVLSTVKMYLEIYLNGTGSADLLKRAHKNISEAIHAVRDLSRSLVTPTLSDIGLYAALNELIEDYRTSTRLDIKLVGTSEQLLLDAQLSLMLFRIVQEQLNNIVKHANANHVTIDISTEGHLKVEIIDDGHGFNFSQKTRGIGLRNIKSRVEFYNGTVKIDTAPGKGCKLRLEIPLSEYEKSNDHSN